MSPPANWTPDRISVLEGMWNRNHTSRHIALVLGVTPSAVWNKAARLGLSRDGKPRKKRKQRKEKVQKPQPDKSQQAMRRCLGPNCGGVMFMSTWPGNRICKSCRESATMTSPSQQWHRVHHKHGAAL